jgi:hypothetical protein
MHVSTYVCRHRAALRYPDAGFAYIGVDPEGDKFDKLAAKHGVGYDII